MRVRIAHLKESRQTHDMFLNASAKTFETIVHDENARIMLPTLSPVDDLRLFDL